MAFVLDHLKAMPYNESACNYLLGLLFPVPHAIKDRENSDESEKQAAERLLKVRELIEDAVTQNTAGAAETPAMLSLLVELLSSTLRNRLIKCKQ